MTPAIAPGVSFAIARRVSIIISKFAGGTVYCWTRKTISVRRAALLRKRRRSCLHACAFRRRAPKIAQGAFEEVQVRKDVGRADRSHRADADHLVAQLGALAGDHGAVPGMHVADDRGALEAPGGHA